MTKRLVRALKWRPEIVATLLLLAVLLTGWQVIVTTLHVSAVILPRPSSIAGALVQGFDTAFGSRAGFYLYIVQTLKEIIVGYVIGCSAGLLLASILAQSPFVERVVKPLIVAFQSVPKIAFAPLVVVWFGFGISSKIVLVILSTFFPLLINGLAGMRSVDPERIDLMRSFAATEWQIFRKVTFPTALPFVFAGLEVSTVYAIVGAIVGEFLGGQIGLGVLIVQEEQLLDVTGIFAVLIVLGCIGALFNYIVVYVRRRVLFWVPSERVGTPQEPQGEGTESGRLNTPAV